MADVLAGLIHTDLVVPALGAVPHQPHVRHAVVVVHTAGHDLTLHMFVSYLTLGKTGNYLDRTHI